VSDIAGLTSALSNKGAAEGIYVEAISRRVLFPPG
jgi:hypothetical protein